MRADSVWSAADTTPEAIERALRELLIERHAANPDAMPARVINLVAVVDRQWSGEIANRLRGVGQYHASRTIVCQVDERRTTLDATVSIASDDDAGARAEALELVVLDVGRRHLSHLETIVDPLVVTDLPTIAWAPHGHMEAIDALLRNSQVVLLDSVDEPEAAEALSRAGTLAERARVVDLAWLRSAPWRERLAALFDPEDDLRPELDRIAAVRVRHEPGSTAAALLMIGWLADRLHWEPMALEPEPDGRALCGSAWSPACTVALTLGASGQNVRGLDGLTIETTHGMRLDLDRGPGGLHAVRREADDREYRWTIMGASRGEGGILGEGIRQALLRDPLYRPALLMAQAFVPA